MTRKTHEQFLEEIRRLAGKDYSILDKYAGDTKKINFYHNVCRKSFITTPRVFIKGRRCPECCPSSKKMRNTASYKQEVYDLVKEEYTVLGEYVTVDTHTSMRHEKCGLEYTVTPYNFLKMNSRCPLCNKYMTKTTDIFRRQVSDLENGNYLLISEYVNDCTHVKLKHVTCQNEYEVTPSNFLGGKRCPRCLGSKGEKKIATWLASNDFIFKSQYRFTDCVNNKPLPFDFSIFDNNEKVIFLIEYDGIQHFKPIDHFGGEDAFYTRKQNDEIKNAYCMENDLPLLRISYWEFDEIESILDDNLNKIKVNK